MIDLRKISWIIFSLISISHPSCATSVYKVSDQDSNRTELQVTPDRVVLQCEDIVDHDDAGAPEGNYGFLIHVLDEANTVTTVAQTNVLDRESCFSRIQKIEKILRDGKKITIGGMGDLGKPRAKGRFSTDFPGKGTFVNNGRTLQFMVIWNEHGQCYGAYYGSEKPCPKDEFPIHPKVD